MPTWSPDGAQIAWAESRLQSPRAKIWLASSDGSNSHPVTRPIDALAQLAWLPGNQLLYDANFQLFRLSLRTLRPVLLGRVNDMSFAIDRAGTIVAVGSPGCPMCGGPISVRSLAGRSTTSVRGGKVADDSPTLSPDGRLVAFSRALWDKAVGEYDRPAGILVSSTAGGPLRQLTRNGSSPSWSPDGRRLVYIDGSNLRMVSAGGRSNVLLLQGVVVNNLSFRPAWSADSRRVAVLDQSERLIVVTVGTHRAKSVTGTAIGRVYGFAWSPKLPTLLVTAGPCTLWAINARGSAKLLRRTC